jgi:hypothetical protein
MGVALRVGEDIAGFAAAFAPRTPGEEHHARCPRCENAEPFEHGTPLRLHADSMLHDAPVSPADQPICAMTGGYCHTHAMARFRVRQRPLTAQERARRQRFVDRSLIRSVPVVALIFGATSWVLGVRSFEPVSLGILAVVALAWGLVMTAVIRRQLRKEVAVETEAASGHV